MLMPRILSPVGLSPFCVSYSCLMYSGLAWHNLSWCKISITSLSLSSDAKLNVISLYHWIYSLYIQDLIIYVLSVYFKIFCPMFVIILFFHLFLCSFNDSNWYYLSTTCLAHFPCLKPPMVSHMLLLSNQSRIYFLCLRIWLASGLLSPIECGLVTSLGLKKSGNFSFCSLEGPEPLY